ncbi:MAG: ATP-binding protein [Spirochaetia bacterium]|jgi:predicted AAA+ superfamily ATPase|nr:ATP-binding protein [Spirochaetia bacterium]
MRYLNRELAKLVSKTVETRPLIYLNGPRQVGKSTLAEHIFSSKEINYISFDSPIILTAAKSDPGVFVQSLPENKLNIIDEIQMAPEIFIHLKIAIDKSRKEGSAAKLFLLTGSANLLALPKLSESLVGRMSVLTLLPFSSAEYRQSGVNFVERLWEDDLAYHKYKNEDMLDMITGATYPEIAMEKKINRIQWFDDYLTTILQRDIQTVAEIRNPERVIQLLAMLSMRVGGLLNNAAISREAGFDVKTYDRYKGAVRNMFLISELPPWAMPNRLGKRFVRAPKLYFNDTNMLCYLMRRDIHDIYKTDRNMMGHLFENFIANEIMKNANALTDVTVSHFNSADGKEIDFVLEKLNGETIGIEVKLSSTLSDKDFANMALLRRIAEKKFVKGIVIYSGRELLPWGDKLWAVPVNYLWNK